MLGVSKTLAGFWFSDTVVVRSEDQENLSNDIYDFLAS